MAIWCHRDPSNLRTQLYIHDVFWNAMLKYLHFCTCTHASCMAKNQDLKCWMIEGDLLVNQHGNYQIYFKITHRFIFLNSPLSLFNTSVPALILIGRCSSCSIRHLTPRMAPWVATSGRVPNTTPKAATCSCLSREKGNTLPKGGWNGDSWNGLF